MLLSRRCVSLAELQQRLEVSRATRHRDLRDLKERMHAPIVCDRDTGSYCIDASVKRFELPVVWFSAGEIHALLSMQQLLAEHIGSLRQRLLGMLESATESAADIALRIRILSLAARPYQLRLPYSNDLELIMGILKYWPDCEVLGPAGLREKVKQLLLAAARRCGNG